MDIELSHPVDAHPEIRLSRPPRLARASDFVSRLQIMQTLIGADSFAVMRLSGQGIPSARKFTLTLHNWAQDAGSKAGLLLGAYEADLLAHLETSMLPIQWDGAAGSHCVPVGNEPFTTRLPARQLQWSGMAFPVRLGANGSGYVVFTGMLVAPSGDLTIDLHMQSCKLLTDLLAADEKKLAPAEALSERETACLQMAGDGCISEVIAEKMGLSVHTVNAYLGTATTKLDAVNRIQAIAKAIRLGYII